MMEDVAPKVDFYLSLPSEADMPSVLSAFYKQDMHLEMGLDGVETVVLDGDPYLVPNTADYAIDIVGVIQKATGNILTDADGNEYPEMAPAPGWHVNVRLVTDAFREVVEALDAEYGVQPKTPARVWL